MWAVGYRIPEAVESITTKEVMGNTERFSQQLATTNNDAITGIVLLCFINSLGSVSPNSEDTRVNDAVILMKNNVAILLQHNPPRTALALALAYVLPRLGREHRLGQSSPHTVQQELFQLLLTKITEKEDVPLLIQNIVTYLFLVDDLYSYDPLNPLFTQLNCPFWMSAFLDACRQENRENLTSLINEASDRELCETSYIVIPLLINKGYHDICDSAFLKIKRYSPQEATLILHIIEVVLARSAEQLPNTNKKAKIAEYLDTLFQTIQEDQ